MKRLLVFFPLLLTGCFAPPQDFPKESAQWQLANPPVNFESLLEGNAKNHKVVVAVADGGIDYNHPRFSRNLRPGIGYDLLAGDNLPHYHVVDPENGSEISKDLDVNDHGTHVSGLAVLGGIHGSERRDFGAEIGLLPIRALPVKSNYKEVTGDMKADVGLEAIRLVGESMRLAHKEGAAVINLSLGMDLMEAPEQFQGLLEKAVEDQIRRPLKDEWKDLLVVAAAGNESRWLENRMSGFPATAGSDNIISVGALANHSSIADYSNNGPLVDVYVRGSDVNSALPEGGHGRLSGTSMASPLITNLAAKAKILAPELFGEGLKALILACADERELEVAAPAGKGKALKIKVANFKRTMAQAHAFVTTRICPH